MTDRTCLHCGALFAPRIGRGRPRELWCYVCCPALGDTDFPTYNRRMVALNAYGKTGIHYCCGECKTPKAKAKAKATLRLCIVCSAPCPSRSRTYCSQVCRQEGIRRRIRQRIKAKDAVLMKHRRQAQRKRRVTCRDVHVEPYDPIQMADRDGWRCQLCGQKIRRNVDFQHGKALTMDHIIPISMGGADAPANVVAAHRHCNNLKGNRVMGEGQQLRLIG